MPLKCLLYPNPNPNPLLNPQSYALDASFIFKQNSKGYFGKRLFSKNLSLNAYDCIYSLHLQAASTYFFVKCNMYLMKIYLS